MVEKYVIRKKTISWKAANGKIITFTSRKRILKKQVKRIYNPLTQSYYSIRERTENKPIGVPIMDLKVPPTDKQIITNALKFIEDRGDDSVWVDELKRVLRGEP